MANSFKKHITGGETKHFNGTRDAFKNLISKREWYKNIRVNGFPITPSNAVQIKRRFNGKSEKGLSLDYMEELLRASGYKIVSAAVWQK